jgi:hypothetical protein
MIFFITDTTILDMANNHYENSGEKISSGRGLKRDKLSDTALPDVSTEYAHADVLCRY